MHSTQNKDDEAVSLAGVSASSFSGPAAREAVIIQFQARTAAASMALEDESSPDMFESIGELSVRLVADWSLPRLVVMTVTGRDEP